jgi:hypothetical protein
MPCKEEEDDSQLVKILVARCKKLNQEMDDNDKE